MSVRKVCLVVLLGVSITAWGQSDGDYQSRATGSWFTVTTWQVYFNGAFRNLEDASAGVYQNQIPNGTAPQPVGEINILSPHVVTLDQQVTLISNPLFIFSGAQLIISNTPSTPDLDVDPSSSIFVEGLLALSNGATHAGIDASTCTVLSGGVYEHRYTTTRGLIIGATWDDGSTIRFTSYANPGNFDGSENLNQDYYDFEWNCPQSGNIDLNGNLLTVRNDLRILATDTGTPSNERLRLFGATNGNVLTIGRDLIISGASSVAFTSSGTGNVIDIGRNYSASATIRTTFVFGTGSLDFNIAGNYTQAGTVHRFTTNSAAICNINLTGNFAHGTSGITNTAGSQANLNFISGGVQTYSGTGTITGPINYFVEGATTLNLGTATLRGTGTFTLRSTATLGVGAFNGSGTNANGAIQTGTTQGNIRVGGVRTYEDESTIVYNGISAQQLGNGHPSTTIVNTIINNSAGVTTVGSRTISGDLTLQSGNLNAVGGAVLTLNRNIVPNSNFITTTATTSFVVNGSGVVGAFPLPSGTQTIANFTLNRPGGSLTFPTNVTISGVVTLSDGELDFTGRTLTLNGTKVTTSGSLSSSSPTGTSLVIGGTGAFGALAMGAPNNQIGTLIMNRTTGGTLTNSGEIFIGTSLTLTNGTIVNSGNIIMDNNATIFRNVAGASITTNRPDAATGETYNVTYTGSTAFSTGLELPDPTNTTDLGNLTFNSSSTITLSQDITVNGNVTLQAGIFSAGANTITMQGPNWNDDAGNFTAGTSTVVFDRAAGTTVGGSSTPQLGNITLNDGRALTFSAATTNVSGNIQFGSSSTFNAGTGTLVLNGSTTTTFSGGNRTFANINLNKTGSADVTLTSGVLLTGTLDVVGAGCDFGSNGFLTLVSDASGTARIAALAATRTVSGNVRAQRYFAGVGRAYRDVSSPVLNPPVSDIIASGITITGNFTGTSFPCAGCTTNNPSMYFYDETVAGAQTLGYVAHPPSGGSSGTSTLAAGRGYNLLIRNELGSPTMTLVGTVNSFPALTALPITYTTTAGGPTEDGWNFVGNPFPSAIDWDAAGWSKNLLQGNTISIWDPTQAGYRTWNGVSGSLGSGRIASGQGFWVKATGAGAALSISEAAKTSTTTAFYQTIQSETLEIVLTEESSGIEDIAHLQLDDRARAEFDEFDGMKFKNPTFNLNSLSKDGVPLSINLLKAIPQEPVHLRITESGVGSFSIRVNGQGAFAGRVIMLHDKLTGKSHEISGKAYSFTVTQSAASSPEDRFYLYFEESPSQASLDVSVFPNPVTERVNVVIRNSGIVSPEVHVVNSQGLQIGLMKLQQESGVYTGEFDMSNQASGVYLVRAIVNGKPEVVKFLKR